MFFIFRQLKRESKPKNPKWRNCFCSVFLSESFSVMLVSKILFKAGQIYNRVCTVQAKNCVRRKISDREFQVSSITREKWQRTSRRNFKNVMIISVKKNACVLCLILMYFGPDSNLTTNKIFRFQTLSVPVFHGPLDQQSENGWCWNMLQNKSC